MDYWLNPPVATSTRYNSLEIEEDCNSPITNRDQQTATIKQIKPPPIFVIGVSNINPLLRLLEDIAKNKYILRIISHTDVKIQAKEIDIYNLIFAALKSKNTEFYSYRRKQDKPFKVVLRNIHCTSNLDLLKTQIEGYEHTVISITNI